MAGMACYGFHVQVQTEMLFHHPSDFSWRLSAQGNCVYVQSGDPSDFDGTLMC